MNGIAFELGGIAVPYTVGGNIQQRIAPLTGGTSIRRMMNGAGVRQTHWRKLSVQLSGEGWCPLGIDALDWDNPAGLTLKCGEPHAVLSNSNVIALPVARRTDAPYLPTARAHLANGNEVPTSISIASHTATLGTVSGAVAYSVLYFPQLVVLADPPEHTSDEAGNVTGWTLNTEEK